MIDIVGVKKRAQNGHASTLMRRFHALVTGEIGTLQSVARAYAWNDSVLLLSYVNNGSASFESAIRDAEKLKRQIDGLVASYAIAIKGRAFPYATYPSRKSGVTIIEASSWAMANCFEVEKALGAKWQKPWYIDIRIASRSIGMWHRLTFVDCSLVAKLVILVAIASHSPAHCAGTFPTELLPSSRHWSGPGTGRYRAPGGA